MLYLERNYLIFINQKQSTSQLLINIYLNGLEIIFNNDKEISFIHSIYNMKVIDLVDRIRRRIFFFLLGHSRTIIGYEQFRNGYIRLLIFDPGTPKFEIEKFFQNPAGKAHIFRRSLQSFQKPVYQILVVRGLLNPDEREVKNLFIQIPVKSIFF